MNAGTPLIPRGRKRHRPLHASIDPHLAERCTAFAYEVSAHDRVIDPGAPTPVREAPGARQDDNTRPNLIRVVRGHGQCRPRSVGEVKTDAVEHRPWRS